jgi:hypothetical protein
MTTLLETRLAAIAAAGETITYGALARDIRWRMAELTTALEDLMESDAAAENPLRSTLCEAKFGHGLPARGFFDKAAALGFDVSDPAAFVAAQRRALWQAAGAATSPE